MINVEKLGLLEIQPLALSVETIKTLERRVHAVMLKFNMVIRKRIFIAAVNSELGYQTLTC